MNKALHKLELALRIMDCKDFGCYGDLCVWQSIIVQVRKLILELIEYCIFWFSFLCKVSLQCLSKRLINIL